MDIATGKRRSVNMIPSVNSNGGLHFRLVDGRLTAAAFFDCLNGLLHDVRGKIFLVVDGHLAHKAKKVAAVPATTKGRLEMFFRPGYSPNLDLGGWVCKNIEHDAVGNARALGATELRDGVPRAVAQLKNYRGIGRGFFRDPELNYMVAVGA